MSILVVRLDLRIIDELDWRSENQVAVSKDHKMGVSLEDLKDVRMVC